MTARNEQDQVNDNQPAPPPPPAAQRALQEAEQRRREQAATCRKPAEHGGRAGPEPTRYGDWEKGGIVSDF